MPIKVVDEVTATAFRVLDRSDDAAASVVCVMSAIIFFALVSIHSRLPGGRL